MVRCILFAAVVFAALTQQASAQSNHYSFGALTHRYSPAVAYDFRSSPFCYRYGYTAAGWNAYVNSHANFVNAQARQVQVISNGIVLQNKQQKLNLLRETNKLRRDIKAIKLAEHDARIVKRRAAGERIKVRRALKLAEAKALEEATLAQN